MVTCNEGKVNFRIYNVFSFLQRCNLRGTYFKYLGCLSIKILTAYVVELLIKTSYFAGDVYIFKLDLDIFCVHGRGEELASGLY